MNYSFRRLKIESLLAIGMFLLAAGCGPGPQGGLAVPVKPSPDTKEAGSSFSFSTTEDERQESQTQYLVGSGIGDVTGPMVGLVTMGYAAPSIETGGLHQRLWARAFVIADINKPTDRVVYVVADLCFVSAVVKARVIDELSKKFGSRYDHANVMLTATHTHSGPGAYDGHQMYNLPAGGFSKESAEAVVKGIVDAISIADETLEPGQIRLAMGELDGFSRNRSVQAYKLNPLAERNSFGSETDREVTLMRFDSSAGTPVGLAHWYAVHATSINKFNNLISGDNKGYAAWKFEKEMDREFYDTKGFVAAFANSNAGDSSPNVAGDVDGDGDWECSANENFACAKWSGEGHYQSAKQLYENTKILVQGSVRSVHQFVDFSNISISTAEVKDIDTRGGTASTCQSAIGFSLLAGSAEDGPGLGEEGVNCSTGGILARVRCKFSKFSCHGEKPVVLDTGGIGTPTLTANVLPTQIFVIGNVALVGVPSEMTTMAGRRLRLHLRDSLSQIGVTRIIIAGYANAYSNYVATREEYQAQNYEGASTLFGEWTLSAYKKTYASLARSLVSGVALTGEKIPKLIPPKLKNEAEAGVDQTPKGKKFGEVLKKPAIIYSKSNVASVLFQGANLRHHLMNGNSIMNVQRLEGTAWTTVAHDWDFATRIYWEDTKRSTSTVRTEWHIPDDTKPGTYRITYNGLAKTRFSKIEPFIGISPHFVVK